MKNVAFIFFLFFTGFVSADNWETNFKKAQEKAAKENKTMLVNFTGSDWCTWCIKLEKEVFDKKEFLSWAQNNVVLVKLDFPRQKKQADDLKNQNKELARKYGIQGYPTILFIDAKGKVLGKSGYLKGGPSAWIRSVEGIIKKYPIDIDF